MTGVRLRARLALAVGAAEVRLRLRFPRLMWALTPSRFESDEPFAELVRIESDPAYRALFFAELDAALIDRDVERNAMVDAVEAAAGRLRAVVGPAHGGRAQ
ncbi:hypothetical protein YUWDRAFT_06828 [Streptomyces sp. AmelKG-D3]|nr:hypothetical protein YUWDRAFT_06828 [Streptomyces sp. AmelKG-D3]